MGSKIFFFFFFIDLIAAALALMILLIALCKKRSHQEPTSFVLEGTVSCLVEMLVFFGVSAITWAGAAISMVVVQKLMPLFLASSDNIPSISRIITYITSAIVGVVRMALYYVVQSSREELL